MSRSLRQDNREAQARERERQARAQESIVSNVCPVCGVDHSIAMADLSHGIIRLMEHAIERMPWMGFPISGDAIARQRAGITSNSLLFSTHWDENDPED